MPHSDHSPSPPRDHFPDLPVFPDNVPTAPLLRISLQKLLDRDEEEQNRCWQACRELGFFYLDVRSSNIHSNGDSNNTYDSPAVDGDALLQDVDMLFEIMRDLYDLDVSEKIKYDFKDQGSYFGYKGSQKTTSSASATLLPSPAVLSPHRDLYESYITSSHAICMLITSLLSSRLPLATETKSAGGLPAIHRLHASSGDQIRFVKAPPQEQSLKGVALGEHTDFGSVTVLFNRLGGLQVRLPSHISPLAPTSTSPPPTAIEKKLCEDGWTY
ncbi:hypothetical protein J4E89_004692, partial [Alternaria sp. Ai002NY15]